MSVFKEYERQVITILASKHFDEDQLATIFEASVFASCEHTGSGYFLTVKHQILPSNRIVCDEPMIMGISDEIECGFVVFLENGELTLECHSWDDLAIPMDIRDRKDVISTT